MTISRYAKVGEQSSKVDDKGVPFWQIAPASEFVFWVAAFLIPILRFINGAPVTNDQATIQVSLLVLSILSAVSLRLYNRSKKEDWVVLLKKGSEVSSHLYKEKYDE